MKQKENILLKVHRIVDNKDICVLAFLLLLLLLFHEETTHQPLTKIKYQKKKNIAIERNKLLKKITFKEVYFIVYDIVILIVIVPIISQ